MSRKEPKRGDVKISLKSLNHIHRISISSAGIIMHQTDLVGLCKRLTAWCVSHGYGLQEYDDNDDDDDATIIVKSNILTENVLHRHITRPPVGQICSRKKGRCVRKGRRCALLPDTFRCNCGSNAHPDRRRRLNVV